MSHDFKSMKREATWKILGHSDIKKATKDATNSDKWGPTVDQLKGLAAACYVSEDRAEVMHNLWKRLESPEPKKWQKVAKALVVLDYIVLHGPEDVVLEVRRSAFRLNQLREFKFVDKNVDHGESVRTKAQKLLSLIKDDSRVREAREKAKRTSARITGGSSVGSLTPNQSHARSSPSGPSRARTSPGESKLVDTGLSDEEMARRLQQQFDREAAAHGLTAANTPPPAQSSHGHTMVSPDEEDDVLQQVMRISKAEAEAEERSRSQVASAEQASQQASQQSLFAQPAQAAQPQAVQAQAAPQPQAVDLFAQPASQPQVVQAPAQAPAQQGSAADLFDPFAPSAASPPPPQQQAVPAPNKIEDFFSTSGQPSPAFDPRQQDKLPEPLPVPQLANPQAQQAPPQQNIDIFSGIGRPSSPAGGPKTLAQLQVEGSGGPSPTNWQSAPQHADPFASLASQQFVQTQQWQAQQSQMPPNVAPAPETVQLPTTAPLTLHPALQPPAAAPAPAAPVAPVAAVPVVQEVQQPVAAPEVVPQVQQPASPQAAEPPQAQVPQPVPEAVQAVPQPAPQAVPEVVQPVPVPEAAMPPAQPPVEAAPQQPPQVAPVAAVVPQPEPQAVPVPAPAPVPADVVPQEVPSPVAAEPQQPVAQAPAPVVEAQPQPASPVVPEQAAQPDAAAQPQAPVDAAAVAAPNAAQDALVTDGANPFAQPGENPSGPAPVITNEFDDIFSS